MPKIHVDGIPDREAVLDEDGPEDQAHKLEINELSRQSVCFHNFIDFNSMKNFHCSQGCRYRE